MKQFALASATLFVVLATPFVVFLRYHGYDLGRPEILGLLLVLAIISTALGRLAVAAVPIGIGLLAATIALALDLQVDRITGPIAVLSIAMALFAVLWLLRAHAFTLVALMATTALAATLVSSPAVTGASLPPTSTTASTLPLAIHLILDEHIGIDGFPPESPFSEMGAEVRSFYEDRGFVVFGGAYSEYFNTVRSLSHLFNLTPGRHDRSLYREDGTAWEWALTRNLYFEQLSRIGYRVHVHQSNWLKLCTGGAGEACDTYSNGRVSVLQSTPYSSAEKALIIASVFSDRSDVYKASREAYNDGRKKLARRGITLPVWEPYPVSLNSLTSLPVLEGMKLALRSAQRGDYILAHLLLPHSPYVLNADCSLMPQTQWLSREPEVAPSGLSNSPESRRVRYDRYVQQLRCIYRKIDELLDAVPAPLRDDLLVIVHGDHGSRITAHEPRISQMKSLTSEDYRDGFSTLFAVRLPAGQAAYDDRTLPITCLMQALVKGSFKSFTDLDGCAAERNVFLFGSDDEVRAAAFPSVSAP